MIRTGGFFLPYGGVRFRIRLTSSREKQPRHPWAKHHRQDDKPCREVIEHFPQRMRLTRCLKVLEAQFTAIDARALDDTMHEPDGGHRGDGKSRRLRTAVDNAASLGAGRVADKIAHDVSPQSESVAGLLIEGCSGQSPLSQTE